MRHRSRVIVLGSNAALRIRNGALDLEHGPAAERIKLKIDIDEPKPCAILFDGRGEFITGEAIRFCARYAIAIILPNGPGRAILFTESALEATDGETLRDVGPAIIRAQCAADPVQVAREIVRTKIAADAEGFGPRLTERDFSTIARCEGKLVNARSVAEIVVIEAKAASIYWRSHRDLGLVERKGGNLPRSWLRFANRRRGADFLANKHASHPISAMVNYCIVVEAGRLARALSGFGLALQIGFLHGDKHGRNSLVWDTIEPLRAKINARVFAFIASHEFARNDFPASSVSTHRIAQPVIAELLARCLSPDQDILEAAIWLRDLVVRYGAPSRQTRDDLSRRGGQHGRPSTGAGDIEAERAEMAASGLAAQG
jgi:CRISP-associated protein Cas1